MATTTIQTHSRRPLRLWPGVVLVILLLATRFGLPLVAPHWMAYGVLGGLAGAMLVGLWWVFFSRAAWIERLGAVALIVGALALTSLFVHPSIATGAQGMLLPILAAPWVSAALVAWAVLTRQRSTRVRRATMVATILVACGALVLVRTGGFTGSFENDLAWRWSPTAEERLLAAAEPVPAVLPAPGVSPAAGEVALAAAVTAPAPELELAVEPVTADPGASDEQSTPVATTPVTRPLAAWPGFRGAGRDGVGRGPTIATDWSASPPSDVWRRAVGPGWSSFAVDGDRFYTQEQRGDDEVVSCYDLATGEPLWMHRDAIRFWEANAGAGPRGTPTLHDGQVFTLGATGRVNALDAATGAALWSRDAAEDTGAALPTWGFSSSPLVTDELVVVGASGSLIAYDRQSGEPRWRGPEEGGTSYSSPQLVTLGGVEQVLFLNKPGAMGIAAADGSVLWQHDWPGYPIVQPGQTAEGDLLLSVSEQSGLRRLAVAHGAEGWATTERWTTNGLKPYFNDFVVHEGHAYGFDGAILAAVELEGGERRWKGGRYGHGQLLLIADQDLLLVLSEKGELALVGATPEGFTEHARFAAIEGKTWNHPVLVGDLLLARNGEEMVALRLPRQGG